MSFSFFRKNLKEKIFSEDSENIDLYNLTLEERGIE